MVLVSIGIDNAPGYWSSFLQWHEGKFYLQGWMVEELVNTIEVSK